MKSDFLFAIAIAIAIAILMGIFALSLLVGTTPVKQLVFFRRPTRR